MFCFVLLRNKLLVLFPSKIGDDDDQKLDNIYFLFMIIAAMLSV